MCLLAILNRVLDDFPVVVAANREESYDRPGTLPQLWPEEPRFVAGKDPRAGGTWLGATEHGVIVAITNRPKRAPEQARSRGLLCRELLDCRSADSARARAIEELNCRPYAGCNVLAIDATSAYVIHAGEKLEVHGLQPGIHVLSRGDVDDQNDPRVARAHEYLNSNFHSTSLLKSRGTAQSGTPLSRCVALLQDLCKDHGDERHAPICLHGDNRGTVSSSIIALSESGGDAHYLHAQGPPCRAPYVDYSPLLNELRKCRSDNAARN